MSDNVLTFPGVTISDDPNVEVDQTDDVPIDRVIEGLMAIKNKVDSVIVIGSSKDGHFYFASSSGQAAQILYDLESARHITMQYGINLRTDLEPEGYEPR